jgi:phage/plasmid primase-like uncharacterized protein
MAANETSPIDPKIRAEFAAAIRRAGLVLDGDPVMDGMLHRVPVESGKPRAKDGTYVGFTDGRPAGFIQNYLSGTRETWTTEGKELTPAEHEHLAAHAQLAKLQRATDLSVQHQTAAERVQAKWDRLSESPPREENAYLARKGVEAFGVKFNGDKLVIPARDAGGKLWSLQNISSEEGGLKLFEKNGRKTGNFHLIGDPKPGQPILVTEGYATGASLHQASGRVVAIAFDSGNIDPVVAALKKRYPDSALFVMGDDDHRQKVNVGFEKALGAAQKHRVGVAFPAFEVKHGLSDFNDLHAAQGLAAVKAQVEAVVGMTMEQSRTVAQATRSTLQTVEGPAIATLQPDVSRSSPGQPAPLAEARIERNADQAVAAVGAVAAVRESPAVVAPAAEPRSALDAPARAAVERPATTDGREPRADLSGLSDWLREPVAQQRALSDRLGVTGDIERLAYEQKNALQIVGALEPKLGEVKRIAALNQDVEPSTPATAMANFVRSVRVSMGIPSVDQHDEYAAWRQDYEARLTTPKPQAPPVEQAQLQAKPNVDATRDPASGGDERPRTDPPKVETVSVPAPDSVAQVVSPALVAREAAHPELDGGALLSSITHRNAEAMAGPRDEVSKEVAVAWVAQDVADLAQIKGDADRAQALFKIGQNGQEQLSYHEAVTQRDPTLANSAASTYMELSAHLIAAQREVGRPAWVQEDELARLADRHAQLRQDGSSVEQMSSSRAESLASADVLSLQRLRGDEREPAALRVVADALRSDVYRETFSREVMRLPESLSAADPDLFKAGIDKRLAAQASDATNVKAVERRSDDLGAVKLDGLGATVARDITRLDLEALRSTEGPWDRLRIVERIAAHSEAQSVYKTELARHDPEISRSVERFSQSGRSVYEIARAEQLHVTGAGPANQLTQYDWALPIVTKGTFVSERHGELTPIPVSAESFAKTLNRLDRPTWDNRDGYVIPAASGLVGDFNKSPLDAVAALARSRGLLLEDDPIARYLKGQPPTPARAVQLPEALPAAAPGNSIEQRAREQQFDDAGTIALRKRIAESNAAVLNDPARLAAGDRTAETLARMTRKELEAFEQAIKRAPEQVQTVLSAAQKRIEGEVELRVGREPVPPLNERYNIVGHLASREYMFRDKPGTAFTEGWLTLKSTHESPDVIKGMLDRADQRGWTAVHFNGTPEFNRQAWIGATARGMKGVGHTPTEGDRAAADAERKRLGREPAPSQTPTGGSITQAQGQDRVDLAPTAAAARSESQRQVATQQVNPSSPTAAAAVDALSTSVRRGAGEPPVTQQVRAYLTGLGEAPANVEAVAAIAASKMTNERVYVGLVTARDYAPYEFKPDAKESPYVKLQGPDGEKTIWGVDLPRALDDAGVKLGDSIALEFRGMRAVSVPVKDFDKAGQVVGWHDETVNRNAWYAAKVDDLRDEALKPAAVQTTPVDRNGVLLPTPIEPDRKSPDRLTSQAVAPTPLPVVGTLPSQPPAHAPTGVGGLDASTDRLTKQAVVPAALPVVGTMPSQPPAHAPTGVGGLDASSDRLTKRAVTPGTLPVVGTLPTQPPAHAPSGVGGLDTSAGGAVKRATQPIAGDGTQSAARPGLLGKDADAPALAAFDAALKQKNVPPALHEPLREIFGRELALSQARGESVAVKVYDPAAKREAPRVLVATAAPEPQQKRGEHKISR